MLRGKKQDDEDDDGKGKYTATSSLLPMDEGQGPFIPLLNGFSLDLRSLALFRVVLALAVLLDTIWRSTSTFSHYANLGVWPVVEAILTHDSHAFSLNFINGNATFQIIIFILTSLASLSLMFGYKTRLSTCIVWGLVVSIHNRNVLVISTGDDLLRMLIFWGMFLPLGERYSVDSVINPKTPSSSNKYFAPASFALIIQFICFYWVSYALKTGVEWEDNTALYYALSIDQYTTPFGYLLLRFPNLLSILTQGYLLVELLLPFFICSPFAHGIVRSFAVALMLVFHLGLGLSMDLAMYTWAPVVGALALLPSYFWDRLLITFSFMLGLRHYPRGLVVYYDADVPVTRTLVSIACTFLGLHPPILAAQQSNEGSSDIAFPILKFLKDTGHCWVIVDNTGKRLVGHNGVLALLADTPALSVLMPLINKLSFLFKYCYLISTIIAALLPVDYLLSTPVYSLPSTRRGTGIPLPPRLQIIRKIRVDYILVILLTTYVAWWNLSAVEGDFDMPSGLKTIGTSIRIDQFWSMFAPFPLKDDGWFIIPARLANGKEVDLFHNGDPVSYDKPKYVSKTFPDSRWRRYLMNLWTTQHQDKRLYFGRYLCRQWNWWGEGRRNSQYSLKTFRIIYMREITLPNYKIKGPDAIVLWEHQC